MLVEWVKVSSAVLWFCEFLPHFVWYQCCIEGCEQFLLGGTAYFFHGKPYLSLEKGYSVNYWGTCSPCAPSVATALSNSTHCHGWFFRKNFTENEVLLIILSVMLSANFTILTFTWCWLILLCFQIKITERQGLQWCWDVTFE